MISDYRTSFWCFLAHAFLLGACAHGLEPVWQADFTSMIVDESPTADGVRPIANQGIDAALPQLSGPDGIIGSVVVSTQFSGADNENALRIYDYDSASSAGVEWNFAPSGVSGLDAIKVSFDIKASIELENGGPIRFGVGRAAEGNTLALNSSINRPFLITCYSDGRLRVEHSSSSEKLEFSFDPDDAHRITIFINDNDIRAFDVLTPAGSIEVVVPNSILLFLDDARVGASAFDDRTSTREFNTMTDNLGRLSFNTTISSVDIDFVIGNISVEALNPYYPALVPADEFEHTVLLSESFDMDVSDLETLDGWSRTSGAGQLPVTDGVLVFDYMNAGQAVNMQHLFRDGMNVLRNASGSSIGPVFYLRFKMRIDEAPTDGEAGFFLGYNNPITLSNMRGFVWLSSGDSTGTSKIGISTSGSDVQYASTPLQTSETYTVLLRYDISRNDTWLWINPTDLETPDLMVSQTGDQSYSRVEAITARFNPNDGLGRFSIDDIRSASSYKAALASGPFSMDAVEIVRGSDFIVNATDYTAEMSFTGDLTRFHYSGIELLASAGAYWEKETIGDVGDRRNIDERYAKAQTDYIMTHLDASEESLRLFLQNNDDAESARYLFVVNPDSLDELTLEDGSTIHPPFASELSLPTSDVVFSAGERHVWLRGIDGLIPASPEHNGNPVAWIDLPSRGLADVGLHLGDMVVLQPQNYQVFQRGSRLEGRLKVSGRIMVAADRIEVRFSGGRTLEGALPSGWIPVELESEARGLFSDQIVLPAGGWYQVEIRALSGDSVVATQVIEHVGIGEVFIGAGQSNSTNSGTTPIGQFSGMASAFTGGHWQLANDPFPGNHDSTSKGSYYSTLGDLLYERLGVPIGIASSGRGGTSMLQWQPDASYRYDAFVYARANGIFDWSLYRMEQLGEGGFRGVLWHQGESDSSHTPGVTRTTEEDYYLRLKRVIDETRGRLGWQVPWFVARASVWPLPTENPNGDENVHRAQERLWENGVAYRGANSDSIGVEYRQVNGSRVHFKPIGLMKHGSLWAERLGDHIEERFGGNAAIDTDGDGLPDYWERLWDTPVGQAQASGIDSDGDRITDLDEFFAGTNPKSSLSKPYLDFSMNAKSIDYAFQAAPFRRYELWGSEDLVNWQVLESLTAGESYEAGHYIWDSEDDIRFFRLSWGNDPGDVE